jgi:Recombination directionality factor-like
MPINIIEKQRRMTEVGRIRLGDKAMLKGQGKPENFRLTSKDRSVLESAAKIYGGKVRQWEPKPGMKEWELYTSVPEIPVLASMIEPSQWFEHWTATGCKRRCDGDVCLLANGETFEEVACQCDPENRECKMTTRVSVMLPDLPSLGVWRLDTHGYYAAVELPEMFRVLQSGAMNGRYIPATLAIEQRSVTRNATTKKFAVPVLRLRQRLGDVLPIAGQERSAMGQGTQALPSGSPALPPPSEEVQNYLTLDRKVTEAESTAATAYVKAIKMSPADYKKLTEASGGIDPRFVMLQAAKVGITDVPGILSLVLPGEAPPVEPYSGPSVRDDEAETPAEEGQEPPITKLGA